MDYLGCICGCVAFIVVVLASCRVVVVIVVWAILTYQVCSWVLVILVVIGVIIIAMVLVSVAPFGWIGSVLLSSGFIELFCSVARSVEVIICSSFVFVSAGVSQRGASFGTFLGLIVASRCTIVASRLIVLDLIVAATVACFLGRRIATYWFIALKLLAFACVDLLCELGNRCSFVWRS